MRPKNFEFLFYSGQHPSLCRGILVFEIDNDWSHHAVKDPFMQCSRDYESFENGASECGEDEWILKVDWDDVQKQLPEFVWDERNKKKFEKMINDAIGPDGEDPRRCDGCN